MEPLTWTGSLGGLIVPVVQFGLIALLVGIVGSFTAVFATSTQPVFAPGGAVITPWRPTTASSLAELILPGIVTGFVLYMVEAMSTEATLSSWLTSTGMPGWTVVTPGPTDSTVPADSWPKISGKWASPSLPDKAERSVPHNVA